MKMKNIFDLGWITTQNLSHGKKPTILEGRGWFHSYEERFQHPLEVSLEWLFFSRKIIPGISITVGGDGTDKLKLHLAIPFLCSLWLGFNFHAPKWFPVAGWWGGINTGISFHDGYINISIWYDEGITEPTGYHRMIEPASILFGKMLYSRTLIEKTEADITLPEGSYPVIATLNVDSWKRPRLPFVKKMRRVNIKSKTGILAHAGKGENSWDLDDDYVYDVTTPANTIQEGLDKARDSIMKDRQRYGWPSSIKMETAK